MKFVTIYMCENECTLNCTKQKLVLITPLCTLPAEVAHATMHAIGLQHKKHESFLQNEVKALMFNKDCKKRNRKMKAFEN
ncbi:hypothetical protein RR48_04961 [Papilio machaon]|uniref:Metalloendopeptidase n=1 Tax=Papilio machaon TaxID=76193 RepID=A0A0N1ING2_PAPMA|nr:hypothetical protein RR48_04961 [Papilio machaon]